MCLALLSSAAIAQAPVAVTTPDGSRFLLCADAAMRQVHWAVASWTSTAEDPLALPGLGRAVLAAAQHGTWNTGSRDRDLEQQALAALDTAWQQPSGAPDAAQQQQQQILGCTTAAEALADPSMLPRLLAALPVHRCELEHRGPASVMLLTTLAPALPEVAAMLIDRRERQALRNLPACWQQREVAPISNLEAELLALALPDHPFTRNTAARTMPSRAEAFAAWARTQRPERTLHVLLGDFDVAQTTAMLQATFTQTALTAAPLPAPTATRPFGGVRRSQVPGVAQPTLLIGWPLPAAADPHLLAAARQWLANGADSCLGLELQRAGRRKSAVSSRASWPPAIGGQGLFVIMISDPDGIDGLTDLVLRSLSTTLAQPPTEAALQRTAAELQQEWRAATADARQLAAAIAVHALTFPTANPQLPVPGPVDGKALLALLRQICLGQPALVEGRP